MATESKQDGDFAWLRDLVGAHVVTSGGELVATAEHMRDVRVVAFYLADATLSRCTEATARLKELYAQVNGGGDGDGDAGADPSEEAGAGKSTGASTAVAAGEEPRGGGGGVERRQFEVVYVSQDGGSDAMAGAMEAMPWVALPWQDNHENNIRARFNLIAAVLPELVFVSSSGELLGTDGVKAIARGAVSADNFPDWRTNAVRLRLEPGPALSGARMHPATLLQCGLYPGDAVVVRKRHARETRRVAVYANPPPSERDLPPDATEPELATLDPADIYIPHSVAHQLGAVDGDTVELSPLVSVPEAESVSIGYAPDSGPAIDVPHDTSVVVPDVLMPYFGVGDDGKADALVALLSREGVDPASFDAAHLSKYITRRQCRYRPVSRGQRFSVPVPAQDNTGATDAGDSVEAGGTSPSTSPAAGGDAAAGAGGGAGAGGKGAPGGGASHAPQPKAWYTHAGRSGWYHFVVHKVAPRDAAHGVVTVGPGTKLVWVSDDER